MTAIVLFGTMTMLLIIGVPISVSLGAATMASLLCFDVPMTMVPQRIFITLGSVSVVAVPLFVLAEDLMTESGISRHPVDFCNSITGNIRGGMGYAMVLACAFFAALSGLAPATVLVIGGVLYSDMVHLGCPKERRAGLLTVSGELGPIIPPSTIVVVYYTITNSSVGDMFREGIVAGLMTSIVLVVICIYYSNEEEWLKNTERTSVGQLTKHFIHALPTLFLPFVILENIYSGLMTSAESATVAVVCSFIVSAFVYRELHPRDIYRVLLASGKSSAMISFITATSTAFSWLFTFPGISGQLVDMIMTMNLAPQMFCLIVALVLLVFDTSLEGIATCVLLVPVLWPMAQTLGISAIHFGMIVCIANVIGCITSPIAVNLFTVASVSKLKMSDIAKSEFPFFLGCTAMFFLTVFVPALSTLLL